MSGWVLLASYGRWDSVLDGEGRDTSALGLDLLPDTPGHSNSISLWFAERKQEFFN